MDTIIIALATSFITPVICCNIASHAMLNVIDKYADSLLNLAKDSIREAYVDKGKS